MSVSCSCGASLETTLLAPGETVSCESCGQQVLAVSPSIAGLLTEVVGDARVELPDGASASTHTETSRLKRDLSARQLARFDIVGHLGAGGMGEVLLARDDDLARDVAAKVIRGDGDAYRMAKFFREARITGQLEHPGIVPVYELGLAEGRQPFLVMRRVEGQTIAELLADDDRPFPLGERLQVFMRICEAIAYAHSRGVIHRDLKPDNVMVGRFGEVYVMDWGLARVGDGPDPLAVDVAAGPASQAAGELPEAARTQDGAVMGTPAYMPPEQAAGELERLGPRSDIYSLGALLYELLCDRAPYAGGTALHIIHKVLEGELQPPSDRTERPVPWELEQVVLRAMAHDPEQRFGEALELRADVERFLTGAALTTVRYTPLQRLVKWVRRNRAAVGIVAACLLAAGLATTMALRHRQTRAEHARLVDEAREHSRARRWDDALASAQRASQLEATADVWDLIRQASMGAEDFAFYQELVPGLMVRLGVGLPEPRARRPLHSTMFDLDEAALPIGAKLLARTATRLAFEYQGRT